MEVKIKLICLSNKFENMGFLKKLSVLHGAHVSDRDILTETNQSVAIILLLEKHFASMPLLFRDTGNRLCFDQRR